MIGLLLLVKAQRAAAAAVATGTAAVDVFILPGTHASYVSVNKQLRDKERVRAAAANPSLKQMIDTGKYIRGPLNPKPFNTNAAQMHLKAPQTNLRP